MQSQKIERFEQFYDKHTNFVHVEKPNPTPKIISKKFHAVFDDYKQQQKECITQQTQTQTMEKPIGLSIDLEDEEDQKLDPEAPAYIPHTTLNNSPWSSTLMPGVDFMQILQSQSVACTTPSTTLPTVPEEGRDDIDSNASTATTSNTTTDTNACGANANPNANGNGYITTNILQQHNQQQQQTLHTPKGFQPISPQTNQSFGLPQMSQMQLPALMRSTSMPDLLSNPPPHPSQFQFSRSYTNTMPQPPQMMSAPTTPITPITPTLSANPTLLNVANGVIPGVEAGLYWYHPQIDKSAVLLPVVIGEMNMNLG